MDFCVAGVPEGVEPTAPRSNDARHSQEDQATDGHSEDQEYEASKKGLELLVGDLLADELDECYELDEGKYT